MSDLFWLSETQMERLRPFFPKPHGRPRVDDRRVLSGIIFIHRNRLRWRDAPREYGPPKTLYNRWVRWSRMGVFARIMTELAAESGRTDTLMIDATHLKTHPHGLQSEAQKGGRGRLIGRTKGGLSSKLHAVTDALGRPIRLFLSGGNVSGYIGARALLSSLPDADWLLADRGYDADWFRNTLQGRDIQPCIPSRKSRKVQIAYDRKRYRDRHRIENMFGRLRDWRRIATRYDRCPELYLSAIALAATVIFRL